MTICAEITRLANRGLGYRQIHAHMPHLSLNSISVTMSKLRAKGAIPRLNPDRTDQHLCASIWGRVSLPCCARMPSPERWSREIWQRGSLRLWSGMIWSMQFWMMRGRRHEALLLVLRLKMDGC